MLYGEIIAVYPENHTTTISDLWGGAVDFNVKSGGSYSEHCASAISLNNLKLNISLRLDGFSVEIRNRYVLKRKEIYPIILL
jgi:hypothetical protein